jgi:hypothetical protein
MKPPLQNQKACSARDTFFAFLKNHVPQKEIASRTLCDPSVYIHTTAMSTSIEKAFAIPFVLEEIINFYDHTACPLLVSKAGVLLSQSEQFCIYRSPYIAKSVSGWCRTSHVAALGKLKGISKSWEAIATQLFWRSYAHAESLKSIMTSTSRAQSNRWSEDSGCPEASSKDIRLVKAHSHCG